eukprot:s164_g24.t3
MCLHVDPSCPHKVVLSAESSSAWEFKNCGCSCSYLMGTEVDIWKTAAEQLTAALYSSRASVIAEPRGKPKDSN